MNVKKNKKNNYSWYTEVSLIISKFKEFGRGMGCMRKPGKSTLYQQIKL